jgi:hypothetical protein
VTSSPTDPRNMLDDDDVDVVGDGVAVEAVGPRSGGWKCTSLVRSKGQSSRMRMPLSLMTIHRPSWSRLNNFIDNESTHWWQSVRVCVVAV